MARVRNPNRDKAKRLFFESNGTASNGELAAATGEPATRIRKWKYEDKWLLELEKQNAKSKKRGGQKGNKNAAGHGAPA